MTDDESANSKLPETPPVRTAVRFDSGNPDRVYFDFDPSAIGGRGGASILFDRILLMASIDAIHRNSFLPPRSTGGLVAEGLRQTNMPCPMILEGHNVERTTSDALEQGSRPQDTHIGKMLADTVRELGGEAVRWEAIRDGNAWHIRAYINYLSNGP